MGLPGLSFSAPSNAYSGAPVYAGGGSAGNINTGSQFSFGGASWPFAGSTSPFDTIYSGAAGANNSAWKYGAVGLGVLFLLLMTHHVSLKRGR